MMVNARLSATPSPLAATLSAILPGLGQAGQGQRALAVVCFGATLALVVAAIVTGRLAGAGAEVFLFMLIVLPWWTIQSYDAYLSLSPHEMRLARTWRRVRTRAHDVRYLGALFLLSAIMDLYIILGQPNYVLSVFCAKPDGVLGVLVKAQSPTIHTFIGFGFLLLRRWALLLYLAYAGFGLINALANFACFGYGRVRTVFLISLVAFTAYVLWRQHCFLRSEPRPERV